MMSGESPSSFPERFQCRLTWRPYQARVLAQLDNHLADNHFHLVAAPGSGKTVVGLEALRRVGKPALIFAPTVAIRDQWIRRFLDSFWSGAVAPAWISTDLDEPGLLTVVTYQSLHRFEKSGALGELAKALEAAGVGTLVFDEAHHLHSQWWKFLDRIKTALKGPVVIALTATPPYDVTQVEWNRYASMCGEVDEEISAPELVKVKNLCPHQDLIYFCEPTARERAEIDGFNRGITSLLAGVSLNEPFIDALRQHPVVVKPDEHIDQLLDDSDYYLSLAVFLKHASGVVPDALLRVLGLRGVTLPPFNHRWAEALFTGVVFTDRDSFSAHDEVVKCLQSDLVACGAIERRCVLLRGSPHNNRLLRGSASKLRGVADIVELESRALDWRLRMLVLTDHIREEDLPGIDGAEKGFTKIGVVPIFEYLRRLRLPGVRLGVLTGRLVLVPTQAVPALDAVLDALQIERRGFSSQPLWHDPEYTRLEFGSEGGGPMLELGTRLFAEGHINMLIGTTALLGEGWDAPAVNSLVMATVIGSHVSSNQIRGRAIRVDPRDPFKTANIWHLACVHPGDHDDLETRIGQWEPARDASDWNLLERRFRAFVGLRHDEAVIESGIGRLGVASPASGSCIAESNARMCRDACDRDRMAGGWQRAIFADSVTQSRVVREVLIATTRIPSHPVMRHWLRESRGWLDGLRRWLLERRVSRIADVLLSSLQEFNAVAKQGPEIAVSMGRERVLVRLLGATCREESIFVNALREIFDPLLSPRYLLVAKDEDFAVPRVLAERKERAEAFARRWRRRVGNARLLFVHTAEGKRRLLRAKERFLASDQLTATHSLSRWT